MRKAAVAAPLVLLVLAGCKIQSDGSDASSSPSGTAGATASTPAPNPSGTSLTVTPDQARQLSQSLVSLVNGPGRQVESALRNYLSDPTDDNLSALRSAGRGFTSAANTFADSVGALDWPAAAKSAADDLVTSLKNAANTVGQKIQQITPQNIDDAVSAVGQALGDVVAKVTVLATKIHFPNLPSVSPMPTSS